MPNQWTPLPIEAGGTGGTTPASARRSLRLGALAIGNTAADITFTPAGAGAVVRPVQSKERDWISAFDFMTTAQIADVQAQTLLLDVTTALNAFIAAVGSGGFGIIPSGAYKTTAFLNAENLRGITLIGSSGQYGFTGTRIVGSHTGKAILSLVGSLFARVENITLEGDTAARPKTGLLLGRSSAASAALHTFINVQIGGYFSSVALYNVASEQNTHLNCGINVSAAPIAGAYFSQGDDLAIGGLTASSMEQVNWTGGQIINADNTAGSTGLFLNLGGSSGHFNFTGFVINKNGGDSYVTIRTGNTDGLDTTFPITLWNVLGEKGTAAPTSCVKFISTGIRILSGFTLKNFHGQAATNYLFDASAGGSGVMFLGVDISTSYDAALTKPSTLYRGDASNFVLGAESTVTFNTLWDCDVMSAAIPTITTGGNNRFRGLNTAAQQFDTPRASGGNQDALVLSDRVTGAQTVAFGNRIKWSSNAGGTLAVLAFEVGGGGANNESQIALYTQNVGGGLTKRVVVGSLGQLYAATDAGAAQTASGIFAGTGVPNNANGNNGDIYFRSDGGAGTCIYQRRAGAWVATGA